VVENEFNTGFTGGNNRGLELAYQQGSDFFWVLNNDTIVDRLSLLSLVGGFENSKVGLTGSKIYFSPGREFHYDRYKENQRGKVLWYAGGIIDWNNIYGSHRGVDEIDRGQYDMVEDTPFVTGCSLMIRRSCLEKIGMFDEHYFAYLEDLDLSVRAKQNGYSVKYIPKSIVWHHNAGSTARPGNVLQQYYMTRNRLYFGMKYASARTKLALAREAFRLAIRGSEAEKKAVIDAALGRYGKRYEWKK
jgi:GT2 family glycosyltransferase